MAAVGFQRRGDHGSVCLRFGRSGHRARRVGAAGCGGGCHRGSRTPRRSGSQSVAGPVAPGTGRLAAHPAGRSARRRTVDCCSRCVHASAARPGLRTGSPALAEIPRWASGFLRAADMPSATRQLTGADTTRRLTRVLASSLTADTDRIDLEPLALAVATAEFVSVDDLANIVEAASGVRRSVDPPSVEQVRSIRSGLRWFPERRRVALLLDVARHHDAGRLAEAMATLRWVVDWAPQPLPTRLTDLVAMCDRLVPVVAPPAIGPTRTRHSPHRCGAPPPFPSWCSARPCPSPASPAGADPSPEQAAADRATSPRRDGQVPLAPPAAPQAVPQRWPVPEPLRTVSQLRCGDLTLCVPTSGAELSWWSRQLHNCLDTFAGASAHGESWLIGVRRDDVLIGCVEVCPRTRRLRQALGHATVPGRQTSTTGCSACSPTIEVRTAAFASDESPIEPDQSPAQCARGGT
jgi:hypothetical protein